ncbi:MAG: YkgJ family cysteine cluster protein [Deltaproteobacteria bacterium]|nr:YkgJ family cysteine cluster protein [Deltaproteobacteria bacterium]
MNLAPFFRNYETLVDRAESAFLKMEKDYGSCMGCGLHCSDCCNAVFGLFLIEAIYIREHFNGIDDSLKEEIFLRADRSDRDIKALQQKLLTFKDDPHMQTYTISRERIRCPFLDDGDECILYHRRPITCRVYGIPTKIQGKVRVCGKSGFKTGESYPVFDLDTLYKDLFLISRELLSDAGSKDLDKASLLISLSKAIRTPTEELIHGTFAKAGEPDPRV